MRSSGRTFPGAVNTILYDTIRTGIIENLATVGVGAASPRSVVFFFVSFISTEG